MEGSANSYARSYLKADLRNTRTLLGLLEESGSAEASRQLEQLVHDVTVGLRQRESTRVDVDALRRSIDDAARAHQIADDTFRQWARSLERVLPWWSALPAVETLLDDSRWTVPGVDLDAETVEIRVTADERFRILGLPRTRDALHDRFERYVQAYPRVRTLRLVDADGDAVFTLVAEAGQVRLAG
jgi:hypothetical protein